MRALFAFACALVGALAQTWFEDDVPRQPLVVGPRSGTPVGTQRAASAPVPRRSPHGTVT